MDLDLVEQRQRAHLLLDVLPEEKLSVVRNLLEVLADPLAHTLANAPFDDEPVSEEEARQIAASKASLAQGREISHEELLAEFGLSRDDFERLGRTPLEPRISGQ